MTTARRFSPDIAALAVDPFDEEVLRHPEPYYERLRETGPLAQCPRPAAGAGEVVPPATAISFKTPQRDGSMFRRCS